MLYFDKLMYETKRSTVGIICQHIKCRTDHFRMYTYIHHHDDMLLPCKKASPFLQRWPFDLKKIRYKRYIYPVVVEQLTLPGLT